MTMTTTMPKTPGSTRMKTTTSQHHDPNEAPTVAEDAFNFEDYDDIMAAYTDAPKKMNDLRLARGF